MAIFFLVSGFAVLIELAHAAYSVDRMDRAARAAARAVAFEPHAPASAKAVEALACRAARSELGMPAVGGCDDLWTVSVDSYATPAALLAGTARGADTAPGGENGDMVAVRLGWSGQSPFARLARNASAGDGGEEAEDAARPAVAVGIARNERAE